MSSLDLSAVALFPLPNVVLLPRAVLPLHIFEQRYKQMTADILKQDRQLAIALLRPGWERSYYARPQIEPVVCVGTIVSHEKLPDGTYNFLLQGTARARIVRELPKPGLSYRVAELEPLAETPVDEDELCTYRRQLIEVFSHAPILRTGLGGQFRKILDGPFATAEVADLVAFSYFEDANLKQALLAEIDPRRRIERTIAELHALTPQYSIVSSINPPNMN